MRSQANLKSAMMAARIPSFKINVKRLNRQTSNPANYMQLYLLISILIWYEGQATPSFCQYNFKKGVTRRCRLPWLTNTALV
jgi:hypothetical protein